MRESIKRVIVHGALVPILLAVAGRAEAAVIVSPFQGGGIVLDGIIDAGYGPGVFASFATAEPSNPGIAFGGLAAPVDDNDLSYSIYSAHTATHLFIAFQVTDQFLDTGPSASPPWWNDSAEVFIDGDRTAGDYVGANYPNTGSREGFQLVADTVGTQETVAGGIFNNASWSVGTAAVVGGYVIEFQIPLNLIDIDPSGNFSPAVSGSTVGFNAAVTDNDAVVDGQQSYGIFWGDPTNTSMRLADGESTWVVDLQLPAIPEPSSGLVFAGLAGCVAVSMSRIQKRCREKSDS